MEPIRLQHVEGLRASAACFDLMRELRPHLASAQAFHEQIERQPLSYASALPPGFGTPGRNGQTGARLNRRGRVSAGG